MALPKGRSIIGRAAASAARYRRVNPLAARFPRPAAPRVLPRPPAAPRPPKPPAASVNLPPGLSMPTTPKGMPDWARAALADQDRQAKFHAGYAQKIAEWLPTVLNPVTEQVRAGEQAYRQQLSNITSLAGQAAAYQPQVQSMSPGGIVEDPFGYARQAAATAEKAAAGYGEQSAGQRSITGMSGFAGLGQGLVAQAAYRAQQLPLQYTQKRSEYINKINQWMAEQQSQQFGDILDFASKQGATISREQIAAAAEQGRNTRAQQAEAGRNTRAAAARKAAAAKAARVAAPKPGGYRGMTPVGYAGLKNTWAGKIDTLQAAVNKEGAPLHSWESIFDKAVAGGLRPSDALRMMKRFYPTIDNNDRIEWERWLTKYLPSRNAKAVIKQLTGGIGRSYADV